MDTSTIGASDHLLLYVDILGTSDFVESAVSDDQKPARLIALLTDIAGAAGNYSADTIQAPDGTEWLGFTPAVSAFSDHVVFSYPLAQVTKEWDRKYSGQPFSMRSLLRALQQHAARLAYATLDLNLLIRGGVAIGPLFHKDGVVVGKALIDAWRLESRVANYPRIVASRPLVAMAGKDEALIQDFDGIYHLDYASLIAGLAITKADSAETEEKVFLERAVERVDQQIAKFNEGNAQNKAAKWTWFRSALEARRSKSRTVGAAS